VSRLYDALRKVEEQGRESPASASKAIVAQPKKPDQFLDVPSLPARIGSESRLIVSSDPHSPGSERFRLIRMALRNAAGGKLPKVLLITSALPKDGKSTVALNLATSLSEGGKYKVLLLEADLHRPSLLENLGLDRMTGLSEVLKGREEPSAALRRIEPLDIYLMAAGRLSDNPSELFQGERFNEMLQGFKPSFDCILVDCPPAFPLADVVALKAHADGVLLVARAGSTPREAVRETVEMFNPGQVLGLVLNAQEEVNQLYEKYYYRKDPASAGRAESGGLPAWRSSQD
jgi:polysaccharide biosynthesis transport protein